MDNNGLQLQMNFASGENKIKNWLNRGEFFVIFEHCLPDETAQRNDEDSISQSKESIALINESTANLKMGHAFSGNISTSSSWKVLDFTEQVAPPTNNTILYISGRNLEYEDLSSLLENASNSGFKNIVPVTGNAFPGADSKQTQKRCYTECIHGLKYLKKNKPELSIGSTVNPFKYTVDDILTQYYKLIKKINSGASFLVSQYGWDMYKLQELQWYLSHRSLHIPIIARILFLTPPRVEDICNGKYPGTHISPDYKAILNAEARYSVKQFEFAQWRRLQLQVAGLKLLGYNGVQLCGFKTPEQIKTAIRFIQESLEEFKHFEEWRNTYLEHQGRAEMAPYPYRCYLFENLFSRAQLEENPNMNMLKISSPSLKEKFFYNLSKKLFYSSNKKYANELFLSKKLITGCPGCSYCRLPLTYYVCPETCPKGLANGVCGGTKADGSCEVSTNECVHARILRLATWQNSIDDLEDRYIRYAEKV